MKKHTQTGRIAAALFTLIFMLSLIMAGCASVPLAPEPSDTAALMPNPSTAAPADLPAATTAAAPDAVGIGYIALDVNPSIQLAIKGGVVLGATAYNDDGDDIIVSYDVVGKSYSEAISMLISALAAEGYLNSEDEPSVVITAYGDVEDGMITDIETRAQQALSDLGLSCPVFASDVSDDMADMAKSYGITPGRYLLISYLADSEGLTLEDAIEKYADWRMGALVRLVGESIGIYDDMSALFEGLTPEQISLLTQAKNEFEAAMKAAVQANREARAAAISAFKQAKAAAQQSFRSSKDRNEWKLAKSEAQQQFQQAKQQAKSMFDAAKALARGQFMDAVKALGLDPVVIERMLSWGFDADWVLDDKWEDPNVETDEVTGGQDDNKNNNVIGGKPDNIKPGGGKPDNKPDSGKPDSKPGGGKPDNKPDSGKPDKSGS